MVQENYNSMPSLERLNVLAGQWNLQFTFPMDPSHPLHGREDFTWMKGKTFLLEQSSAAHPDAPDSTGVIGADDDGETFTMHYFDSRGVTRIYKMSLNDGVWKLWRDDPEFSQRFEGTFSEDGNTITAYWEKSSDGTTWERDFDIIYSRVTPGTSVQATIK